MVEITKSHVLPILAILLAIIAGAVSIASYNQISQLAEVPEMQHCHKNANCVEWLNENYVSKPSFNNYKAEIEDQDVMTHFHNEYSLTNHGHTQYAIDNHFHQTNTDFGADLDLYTSTDSRGDDREDRFDREDVVYIIGDNDSSGRDAVWEIRDPDGDKVYSRNTGISQYGEFSLRYPIPDDALRGTYTVIVEIDRDEDTITFVVD